MSFQPNFSLQAFNTFRIAATAYTYASFSSVEDLQDLLPKAKANHKPILILGGGSNMLFTAAFLEKTVLHNQIEGIRVLKEDANTVLVEVGGGVPWHSLVMFAVKKGWYGIENLALIPGTVGAAPIQNIGAYGMELKDSIHSLKAVEIETGQIHTFLKEACDFGYRDSYFKKKGSGKFIITSVVFNLNKSGTLNFSYKGLEEAFQELGFRQKNLETLAACVIHVRRTKLPDPAIVGNAGSFFKNPELTIEKVKALSEQYPQLPQWPQPNGLIKIPAAWLIEQAGWKGYKEGDYGVHSKQPLVLVNYGNAQGNEIKNLAFKVIDSIKAKFGVELTPEVNLIC